MFSDDNYSLPVIACNELSETTTTCPTSIGSYGHVQLRQWRTSSNAGMVTLTLVEVWGAELTSAKSSLAKIRWNVLLDRRKSIRDNKHKGRDDWDALPGDPRRYAQHLVDVYGLTECHQLHYLVMEHSPLGTLCDLLHTHTHIVYKLCHALLWSLHAARGLSYLHELGIKPKVLNTSTTLLCKGGTMLKLSCHSASILATRRRPVWSGTTRHNPLWMAPETLEGPSRGKQTRKSNIYSLAMLLWESLSRQLPFAQENATLAEMLTCLIEQDYRPAIQSDCPRPLRQLIEAGWHRTPQLRPAIDEMIDTLDRALALLGQLPAELVGLNQ